MDTEEPEQFDKRRLQKAYIRLEAETRRMKRQTIVVERSIKRGRPKKHIPAEQLQLI